MTVPKVTIYRNIVPNPLGCRIGIKYGDAVTDSVNVPDFGSALALPDAIRDALHDHTVEAARQEVLDKAVEWRSTDGGDSYTPLLGELRQAVDRYKAATRTQAADTSNAMKGRNV